MNVSILICTHGDERWRELGEARALPSALLQEDVAEVRALHSGPGSLAEVRNIAGFEATGDWLVFLDADDELAPGYVDALRAMHATLKPRDNDGSYLLVPAIQYVCGQCGGTGQRSTALSANGRELERHERNGSPCDACGGASDPPAIPSWERSLIEVNCACIGTAIPRITFQLLGGFRDLSSLEDWDLWLRAVRWGAKMIPVPEAIYRAHQSDSSRNADQSPYWAIRSELEPGLDWATIGSYKEGL